jgi:hypothetical protein
VSIWEQLHNPPNRYRSVPLWSWNDRLDSAELERQIEEMHKAGIGGFFMHARGGLQTPYMSEEWMEAIRICTEKALSLGMSPWLYDENGWPSGFADGKVPAKGLAWQQKRLAYEEAPFQAGAERTIAYYARTEQGYSLLAGIEESDATRAALRIYYEVNPYYTDTLSPAAVRAFLDTIHEEYWRRFGPDYGDVLRGIFTDEPQFARGELPWSFELEQAFISRCGYSLKEALPGLFLQIEGCRKARYDYWACVTSMFVTAYAKQIYEWCGERGWSSVGHVVDEQALMNQVTSVGDPMAFYEYLQIPGCDWLGRFISEEPIVPKQVGSAARQLGRKQTITESFGCSGWNASFEDLRRIGEWQYVHGINLMCQHLQGYSLRGNRKRDYPPSLFYQQPWWEDYSAFNDYFARLSMLLAEGTRLAEVLLLHPVRSAWVEQCGTDSAAVRPYHEAFARLSRWLCQSLIEHDYGSESIIEGHGRVDGGRFIIGEAAYRAVIVPPAVTLDRATVELLKQFAAQGGRLVAFAPYPQLINGAEADGELERLFGSAVKPEWNVDALVGALEGAAAPFIRIRDGKSGVVLAADTLNVQTLELDGALLYYLVNSGQEHYPEVHIELAREGAVSLIDLAAGGTITPVPCEPAGTGVRVKLPLYPYGSYMLRLEPHAVVESAGNPVEREHDWRRIMLDGPWKITHADHNSLTLDTCRLRVEDGEWSDWQPLILIQEQLLGYGRPVHIELEFSFHVEFDADAARDMYIVLERPEETGIELNGRSVQAISCGWWRDISFHKIDIGGMIVPGANTVRLKSYFYHSPETYRAIENAKLFEAEGNKLTLDTELESIYIVGAFGVKSRSSYYPAERGAVWSEGPFVLTERPEFVENGDLVGQGFPFFAGKLRLQQTVALAGGDWTQARWSFGAHPDYVACHLRINGEEAGAFFWEPYEADIAAWLREGDNVIELELANSCRNLLGPHHHIKGEVHKVGPDSFKDKPGWTDKDVDKNTCIYVDRYSFVRFGLQGAPCIEY